MEIKIVDAPTNTKDLHVHEELLFITAIPIIKLFARGEGDGGHVL
jgi:hypothetical protein